MVNTIVYKKKITRWLEDMNLFSRGEKQHSTHSMRLFVKYCFHHSKIYKFISSRRRVIYHISKLYFSFTEPFVNRPSWPTSRNV